MSTSPINPKTSTPELSYVEKLRLKVAKYASKKLQEDNEKRQAFIRKMYDDIEKAADAGNFEIDVKFDFTSEEKILLWKKELMAIPHYDSNSGFVKSTVIWGGENYFCNLKRYKRHHDKALLRESR